MIGQPALHRPTSQVTEFGPELTELIEDMFATMYLAEGVGLAATQVGVGLAVFVYDCPDDDGVFHRGHIVNPVVVSASDEVEKADEGCLSVPGPFAPVARPVTVTVRGVDKDNNPVEVTGSGFFARCLAHETDHLSGTLYVDHLNKRKRSRVLAEMEPTAWNAPLYVGEDAYAD